MTADWDVTVEWTVEAGDPREAAELAWGYIRESTRPIMHVRPFGTVEVAVVVDLSEGVDGYG